MHGTLTQHGTTVDATLEAVEAHLATHEFFWLDLDDVDGEAHDMLSRTFNFHPLAVEGVARFGQRPKLDDYDDFTYMVVHGADANGTVEVHFLFRPECLVTVHHGECGPLNEVRERIARNHQQRVHAPQIAVIYLVVDALVDGFFPVLDELDNRIDALEDAILAQPTEAQLGTLFQMKRLLVTMRKVITPQRDMFARISSGISTVPGMTDEGLRYFRDLYDHVIRISDLIDSNRDLLSGIMDTHLSTVSNRLNVVMKQLTIIATIFLPLSFLTGFFGQNFGWMVNRIRGPWVFVILGIGIELATAAALFVIFRRRGWLSSSSA